MKKTFTTLFAGMLLFGGLTASAQLDEALTNKSLSNDQGALVPNQVVTLDKGNYCTYVTTSAETIEIQTNWTGAINNNIGWQNGPDNIGTYFSFVLYTDFLMDIPAIGAENVADQGWKFTYSLDADKTYVFGYPNENTDMSKAITIELLSDEIVLPPSDITSIEPVPGVVIDTSLNPDVIIKSSKAITSWSKVSFNYGNESIDLTNGDYPGYVTTNGYPEFLQIYVNKPDGLNLIDMAANAGASECKIVVEGLVAGGVEVSLNNTGDESNVSVVDGTVTVTYPVAAGAAYLADESTWPEVFYSLWPAGDDRAKATLKFSKDIASIEEVMVAMGHVEPGAQGGEGNTTTYAVTPSINGSEVTLDFAGVARSANVSEVTVTVSSVKDTDGLTVNFETGAVLYQYIQYQNTEAPGNDQPGTPEYMANGPKLDLVADVYSQDLFIYWDETIFPIVEDGDLTATLTTPNNETVEVTLNITSHVPDAVDEPSTGESESNVPTDNALLLQLSQIVSKYGNGEYTINLESIVMNEAGEWNTPMEESFTVELPNYVEGEVSPESGTTFLVGEEVSFTISFEGTVVANEDAERVAMLMGGPAEDTVEVTYDWSLAGIIYVTADSDAVVIDLGNELEPGFYSLSIFEDAWTVDGDPNGAQEIMFEVATDDSDAINSILNNLDENAAIYNLQGVKMNKPVKGINIINGKKVVVK